MIAAFGGPPSIFPRVTGGRDVGGSAAGSHFILHKPFIVKYELAKYSIDHQ